MSRCLSCGTELTTAGCPRCPSYTFIPTTQFTYPVPPIQPPKDGPGSHVWDLVEMQAQRARADRAEAALDAMTQERDRALAHAEGYRRDFLAELDGAAALRKQHGARENETFSMFVARLAAAEVRLSRVAALAEEWEAKGAEIDAAPDSGVSYVEAARLLTSIACREHARALRAALETDRDISS